jgi:hypothetical protein
VRIVRLQVQQEPLKRGEKPHRWYDPTPIRQVDRLLVDDRGATGVVEGAKIIDVHHVDHPRTRNNGRASGLSIGFTAHYDAMRARFGDRVIDGVAGENVLVASQAQMTPDRLAGGALRTRDGQIVPFIEVEIAEPCVEFSRFVLGVDPFDRSQPMREPLRALRGGMRGFYVALAEPVELTVGDDLLLDDQGMES